MTDKPRNYNEELANIMNAMAESTLDMTDEEVEAEIREEGRDPDAVAERVRDVVREALKDCQQRPLLQAQKRYDERVAALRVKKYEMPEQPQEQRAMIHMLLAANPQLGPGFLTAQFREFENLADEDVGSCLRQLLELMEAKDAACPEEGER
jgi:predicted transcriptional regulator